MVSKINIALIAAVAAVGIATPALADGAPAAPQYSQQSHQTAVRGRALYNSAVPSNDSNNWANDSEWSTSGRQSSGR